MNAYGQRQYRHTQITTVDKGRLIVLLYEGAIKCLHQAKDCQSGGDLGGKANQINKALDIIAELNQSLNMSAGGELSGNLRKLYNFWSDHLVAAKIKPDAKNMDEVIDMMSSLNEAWDYVASLPEAQMAVPKTDSLSMRTQVRV